jgi:hypothetical protein
MEFLTIVDQNTTKCVRLTELEKKKTYQKK